MSDTSATSSFTSIIAEYNASRRCVDKGTLCHAPENSLYFGRDGIVSACCYSRSAPIGSYPQQTIAEIWNSAQAEGMRRALRQNKLPEGCELCADKLRAHNFTQLVAQTYDDLARPPRPNTTLNRIKDRIFPKNGQRWPQQMEFELSNKCNLACAMCSGFFSSTIRASREKLPPLPEIYDDAFVEQLRPFLPHLQRAKFLGGEPFLIDVYYKIWDALIEVNPDCKISITTNGTVFNKTVQRILERLNCQVIISLDSVHKATYEQIRVNAKMERTLENVESFVQISKRKNRALCIAICPMKSNWQEIPDLVQFANARGISINFNIVVFPSEQSLQSLSRAKKKEIAEYFRSACGSPENEIASNNYRALLDLSSQLDYWSRPALAQSPLQKRCLHWLQECQRTSPATKEIDWEEHWFQAALSDLAEPENFTEIEPVSDQDVKLAIKTYLRSIWRIGRQLQNEDLIANMVYGDENLLVIETFIDQQVNTIAIQRMMNEFRRFAPMLLEICGTRSGEQVIQINKEMFGLTSNQPAATELTV